MSLSPYNTLFIGKVAIHLESIDSTNRYANEMISKSSPIEGTVIYADEQVAGRGQIGSKWSSSPCQNITMSIVLRPNFLEARKQFLLNQAIALGIWDMLAQHIDAPSQVSIKWPNDIYINAKKIGGVLIENRLKGSFIDYSIIGIGLNINQTLFDPKIPNPTSLALTNSKNYDLKLLIEQLCSTIEQRYLQLRSKQYTKLKEDYLSQLYLYQQAAAYYIPKNDTKVKGIISGISDQGHLLVKIDQEEQAFSLKEIKFLHQKL
ncbi:MAG: biotin--[acetyl-CoA-carboxylase] ligase [Aureispira sp.]|nr:biotin--[acetyl-CoA-carboxylase] ligase [Aureispira sp.]